jgi:aspartate racemase
LAKAHEAQGRTLDIVIAHAELSRVLGYVEANDPNGLAEYLSGYIHRLKAAGAEVAVIPAVTPHFCLHELVVQSPLPILSIFEPLRRELAARNIRRVAVFGTRFVIQSALFGELRGVEVVSLTPAEVNQVHDNYVELARTGNPTPNQYADLTALAHKLVQQDGVAAILLAGTDLSLLFNEANITFPYIDCAALHLQAILRNLLDDNLQTAD